MASIKFFIRNMKLTKPASISVKISWPIKREVVYSTGIKIKPVNWDAKNQKVRNRTEVALVKDEINNKLDDLRSFLSKKLTSLQLKNSLNKDNIKHELNVYFNKVSAGEDIKSFFTYVKDLIEKSKKRVEKVTWRSYERTVELLRSYEKERKVKIDFESINMDFYYSFIDYLEESHSMMPNTIGKQIKNVKMFMNSANEDGHTELKGHKHKHFKVLKESSFQIYLTEDELEVIKKLDLKLDSIEDRVRDLFLIGAWTGQRISDWKKLNDKNIYEFQGVKCFKIKQEKTGTEVVIPIHPDVVEILAKRNGKPPKFISEPIVNEKIKIIGKKAKVNDMIPEKENSPKHELISSHTARRSFCTNAYKSGMDSLAIMQLSGHKTEKSFLAYIKISKEEFAARISKHLFFNERKNV